MILLKSNKIIRIMAQIISPLILVFGLYIQFAGMETLGGGFQSGIILSMPFILYIILFGEKALDSKLFSIRFFRTTCCIGALLYLLNGMMGIFMNSVFLDYSVYSKNAIIAQEIGISITELSIFFVVFASVIMIFMFFYKKSNS